MAEFAVSIDARTYPPKEKHPAIFGAFDSLKLGETMELVNDHDPRPLYFQLMAERPNQIGWEYLEQGPVVWRAGITKINY